MSETTVSRAEFEALLRELADVKRRLAEMESRSADAIDEETIQIIAAAVAAYLGKRATIRVVRRREQPDDWRVQGRTALQGSHGMPRTRALHR